jgi:hypothetical protein
MWDMANLQADLQRIIRRHRASSNEDVQEILLDLSVALDDAAGTAEYQYRNHPTWDTTWMDLDPVQVAVVLKHGHTVERRLIAGDWEAVTEAPA